MTADTVLVVESLGITFGGLRAVDDVSFVLGEGEVLGLIGPNGAGKSSVFNGITGFYRPSGGRVLVDGHDVTRKRPSRIASRGVARTFQNIRLFPELSVLDNVRAGCHLWLRQSVLTAMLRTPGYRRSEQECTREAHRWLDFVGLEQMTGAERAQRAGTAAGLPYGGQRLVEIARALAQRPKILILDEPAAGFTAAEKHTLADLIRRIRAQGIAVILVEHDMALVRSVADRVVVLHHGRKIADGTSTEVWEEPAVIDAYLGSDEDALAIDEIEAEPQHADT